MPSRRRRVRPGQPGAGSPAEPPAGEDDDLQPEAPQPLPYIVVVVDEFADLMMTAPKRSGRKNHPAGTNGPGVGHPSGSWPPNARRWTVVTGLIKANFPDPDRLPGLVQNGTPGPSSTRTGPKRFSGWETCCIYLRASDAFRGFTALTSPMMRSPGGRVRESPGRSGF